MNFKKISQAVVLIGFIFSSFSAFAAFSDKVLVIINEDVITQSEYDYRLKTVKQDIQRNQQTPPAGFEKQLLESMVSDRLQVQEANRRGISISDQELNEAIQRFAQQQKITVSQLLADLQRSGQPLARFQETVRDSLTISRLTEYYARTRVVVPDYEIRGFIEANKLGDDSSEYQVAHIMLSQPEQNRELADQVRSEIRNGLSFQEAVLKYSEGTNAQEGGVMGWLKLSQMPDVFQDAIKNVEVGQVTDVLESANGLHILKLLDLKGDRTEIVQTKVRHILVSSESRVAKKQAAKQLRGIRKRIVDGEDFSQLARIFSDDSVSAATGGSLDWVSPGQMVKPFEDAFDKLAIGQVSEPIDTQYGVHLIKVEDRRKKNVTDQVVRNRAENFLRRQRADREFKQWIRELKEQAYVEYLAEPSA